MTDAKFRENLIPLVYQEVYGYNDLYNYPLDLNASLGNNGIAEAVYRANKLAYHNLKHIKKMLSLIPDDIKKQPDLPELVAAIFWHDVVYVPGESDNEEKSVNLFKIHNEYTLNEETKDLVSSLIMATKDHSLTLDASPKISTNLMMHEVIIDLDLYNLGGTWEEYIAIGKKIRQEYSAFTDEEFLEGRVKFLEKFLRKGCVYLSGFFMVRELQAQMNMERELYIINRMGKLPCAN